LLFCLTKLSTITCLGEYNLYSELNHHAKLESEKASLLQIPIRIGSPDFSSVNNLFMSCAFKTETAKHRIKK